MTRFSPRSLFRRASRPTALARRPARFRPALLALEGRALLSTLDVAPGHTAANDPNDYPTISAAVAAASPGDTILVAPGVYNESVTIPSSKAGLKIIGGTPTDADDPQTGPSIVHEPSGTYGFNVLANNVTIKNFTVDGLNQPSTYGFNLDRAVSGDQVLNNVIEHNTFGLYLASNGAKTTVIANDQFLDNNAPGAAQGNGIYSDQGARNVVIKENYFTKQTNASIILVGGPGATTSQSNIGILSNRIIDDAPVIVVNTTQSVIADNTSLRSSGSGIFLGGGNSNDAIVNNTLRDGAFTGINLRTDSLSYNVTPGAANHDILIACNTVTGFGDSGIRLRDGAYNNSVVSNRLENNGKNNDPTTGDGISLESGAHDNYVARNRSLNNRRYGIGADATTQNNLIERNTMLGNKTFDAFDASSGGGTAGTANTWRKNKCKTENRPGLCDDHGNGADDDGGNGHDDNGHDDNDHRHDD